MQNELKSGPLLNSKGRLAQSGWATRDIMSFNRKAIKVSPFRIKEWDFYQISDEEKTCQFTIGHTSYVGLVSFNLFFYNGNRFSESVILPFPFSSLNMPKSADNGDLSVSKKNFNISFKLENGKRILKVKSTKRHTVEAEIILEQNYDTSLVIATPFEEKPKAFYYNNKINCMRAKGEIKIGDTTYSFKDDAYGLLDWGRGVWPYHAEWYWGNGSTTLNGKPFGFNIGWGFGDTSNASENMLFYDGVPSKIEGVYCDLAKDGYMGKKHFSSTDGRFEMDFTPIFDNYTTTKALIIDNACHQVFGKFNGYCILDSGEKLVIKDMLAFCEHAVNNW